MDLTTLVDNLLSDTLRVSLPLFRPELAICATIVVLLLVRLFRVGERLDPFWIAIAGSAVAFWLALPNGGSDGLAGVERVEIFTGMLVYDSMTVFFRLFLLAFAVWFIVLTRMTGLADRQDGQDFYSLLLGSILGMCLMASANHLMTVFLAVEMASVPSYVMAGIIKGRRRGSEAALKYAVYGAGAAGVMLYGISLLAGLLGTAHLPTIASQLVAMDIPAMIAGGQSGGILMVLALSAIMIMVGLAFKLSAVPFHFWCPDVFEGASAEVDAFLSVASKGAAMALLIRVALGASAVVPSDNILASADPIAVQQVAFVQPIGGEAASAAGDTASDASPLAPVRTFIVELLAVIAAVTCTFGNLVAYGQTNIKRLLAYSTIAHAGYMMMAVAAAVYLVGHDPAGARGAVAALMFYLTVYVFMNLGAFAIVAFLRSALESEEIADYAGLIRSMPLVGVALTTIMVSLVGIPPLAGFMGKFYVFYALVDARQGPWMIALLVIAGLNTAVSLVYYLRVAWTVCVDPEPNTRGPVSIGFLPALYVLLVSAPVLYYGINPTALLDWARAASQQLLM
ncbi:MAG: NADH-quinone oxidoreductase subunit N [Pirellulales bacterium]